MSFRAGLTPTPTGGALFNRKEPRNAAGEIEPILNRRLEVRKDVQNHIFNDGKDFTGLRDRHPYKYRIPNESVVNKVVSGALRRPVRDASLLKFLVGRHPLPTALVCRATASSSSAVAGD